MDVQRSCRRLLSYDSSPLESFSPQILAEQRPRATLLLRQSERRRVFTRAAVYAPATLLGLAPLSAGALSILLLIVSAYLIAAEFI